MRLKNGIRHIDVGIPIVKLYRPPSPDAVALEEGKDQDPKPSKVLQNPSTSSCWSSYVEFTIDFVLQSKTKTHQKNYLKFMKSYQIKDQSRDQNRRSDGDCGGPR